MKRDTIFYRIFQQSPTLLFDLLPNPPSDQAGYTFESIEVKETSFRIDGVLLPPTSDGSILFSEIQMQPDQKLYERLFSEVGVYTYRHTDSFTYWQALAIYPNREIEQSSTKVPQELFDSGRIMPIYLDELGSIEQLPLGLALLVLTILEGQEAINEAQNIMARARASATSDAIMEMVSTIMVYKFTTLSRDEVNAMLGYTIDELKQTRVYQEAKEEGREEERASLLQVLLKNKIGDLSGQQEERVLALSADRRRELTIALLDFTSLNDLDNWFRTLT
jgi:predicted transposase/invertase (TIGR01784 family)